MDEKKQLTGKELWMRIFNTDFEEAALANLNLKKDFDWIQKSYGLGSSSEVIKKGVGVLSFLLDKRLKGYKFILKKGFSEYEVILFSEGKK